MQTRHPRRRPYVVFTGRRVSLSGRLDVVTRDVTGRRDVTSGRGDGGGCLCHLSDRPADWWPALP